MIVLKIFPVLTKAPQSQVLSYPNLVWYFPRRTCEQSRILQKTIKIIILKKSCIGIRVSKLSVLTKRLQVIKCFAVYAQHNLNIIEVLHAWFNSALDGKTKFFSLSMEWGRETWECLYHRECVCVLIYHSEFAQASTEDVENMTQDSQLLSKGTIQQLNHTVEHRQFLLYLKQAFLLMLPPFLALSLFFWIPGPKIETLTWRKTKLLDCGTTLHMATRENCIVPDWALLMMLQWEIEKQIKVLSEDNILSFTDTWGCPFVATWPKNHLVCKVSLGKLQLKGGKRS